MNIDARLEALTHTVELLAGMQVDTEKRLARLEESPDALRYSSSRQRLNSRKTCFPSLSS